MSKEETGNKKTTDIKVCNCVHPYQDELYGKSKRVFNAMGSPRIIGYRCTVCGKESKI